MFRKELIVLSVFGLFSSSWQASTPTSPFYTAGVVEFKRAASILSSSEQLDNNLAAYLEIIASPEAAETDIIVFPEATLNNALETSFVPDPKSELVPCNQSEYAYFLQKLSCQAKTTQKYIVVNLVEKENCTASSQAAKKDPRKCASNGYSVYNSNVVFDRKGAVISRYRKYNLYFEPWNVTYTPEYGQFNTDFGVKFGHFICFDMLFYTPTTELIKSGISDFIFTTMWFSELPFLTAVQYQQSWAYSYDVNLLAAGASNPSTGNTGSGIYVGKKGALVSVMKSSPERKIYVAKVPKKGFNETEATPALQLQIRNKRATSFLKELLVKRDSRIDAFTTAPFDPTAKHAHICHGDLCCHFNYETTKLTPLANSKSYQYRLAAFDGNRLYPGIDPLGWSICSIIACTNSTIQGCGLAFDEEELTVSPEYRFDSILIEANFTKTENVLLMPNSVDDDLMPLTVESFLFNVKDLGGKKNARFELLTPRDDLIQFGIYVNYFGERSAAMAILSTKLVLVFAFITIFISNLIR